MLLHYGSFCRSSEESGDDSEGKDERVLRRKPLPWRSQDANALFMRVDAYYKPKKQTDLAKRMSRARSKRPGHDSTRACPADAPAWAIQAPAAPPANNNANHNGQQRGDREHKAAAAAPKRKGKAGR